jgi:N-acetylmuramoyl-L-alanine amidase
VHEFTRTASPLLGALALAAGVAGVTGPSPLAGCGRRAAPIGDGDEGAPAAALDDARRARALGQGEGALPPRAEALALAESIEARALREGAGARAATLHLTAARLVERVWRVEGRDRDASEALDLYRAASRDPESPGACEAALAGARLAGDAARDATLTYTELYRAQRRFAPIREPPPPDAAPGPDDARHTCRGDVEDALVLLAAFRPPQHVLDALEAGLAGEGMRSAAGSSLDGGPPATDRPPQVVRIESWPGRDAARIVVVLDRPAAYRIDDEAVGVDAAARTFLDLDGVDLGAAPRDTPGRGIVSRIRADPTSTGSRIAIDLDGRAFRRAFVMRDPYRIVIDVAHHPPGATGRSPRAVTRLVLDPGHGGKDAGAVGSGGLREKDVTLDIARRAAPILSAKGIQVVLTRDDDRFVSLEERTARANAFGADLFVSIHCNASEKGARRGVETYVLDTSRDELASRVAARENATTQAATAELASILGDLRLADQSQRSTRFAQLVERTASSAIGARYGDAADGGVHTAGFYVLVGADMPGVLLETSYISNTVEEQRLASDEYRQLLADAIANAVKAYREGR